MADTSSNGIGGFMNSPAGQALLYGGMNAVGSGLSAYGQAQQSDAPSYSSKSIDSDSGVSM